MGTLRLVVLMLLLATGVASANCPDQRASCVLHEEGVALLMENKHQQAAEKFAAAIAAEPTARSYLGYAQSVEALGQIALAYDTLVKAQQLSQIEVKAGANADATARAERIKYKLGELRAKIGFAWLRLPQGVQPSRVVSVQRQGEGALQAPFTQWTAVAPGKQTLIATIDSGQQITVVAEVAAGSQGVVIIPVAGGVAGQVDRRGTPPPPPVGGFQAPPPAPSKPIYKKWWFWTLVVIGTLLIISATTSDSGSSASGGFRATRTTRDMFERPLMPQQPVGATVFRF